MKSIGNHKFTYTFPKVSDELSFRLTAVDYYSQSYRLAVLFKPELQQMRMTLNYPAYTGKKSETMQGLSDVTVPVGTTIHWQLGTDHTDDVQVKAGNVQQSMNRDGNVFSTPLRFMYMPVPVSAKQH